MGRARPWDRREDGVIAVLYPTGGARACAEALGRSEGACSARAKRLGVASARRGGRHHMWTREEDRVLAMKLTEAARIVGQPLTSVVTHMSYLVAKSRGWR